MTDEPRIFRAAIALPTICMMLVAAAAHDLAFGEHEPLEGGFLVFRLLSRPEAEPVRIAISCVLLWMAMMAMVHIVRRLAGHILLEVGPERIVFQGLFRREIPIDQIERIDDEYGAMLIRMTQGRPVRIPILFAADFYGAKRALERVNQRVRASVE